MKTMNKKDEFREVLTKNLRGVSRLGKEDFYWEADMRRIVEEFLGVSKDEFIYASANGQYITLSIKVDEGVYGLPILRPFACVKFSLKKGDYDFLYSKYYWYYNDFSVYYFDDFETVREKYKEEKAKQDDIKEKEIEQVLDTVYKLNMSINEFDEIVSLFKRHEIEIKKRLEK